MTSRLEVSSATDRGACPDPESLALLVEGNLPPTERAVVSLHLDGCPQCHQVVAATVAALEDERATARSRASRRR